MMMPEAILILLVITLMLNEQLSVKDKTRRPTSGNHMLQFVAEECMEFTCSYQM